MRKDLLNRAVPRPAGELARAVAYSAAASLLLPRSDSAEAGKAELRAAIRNGEHEGSAELETLLLVSMSELLCTDLSRVCSGSADEREHLTVCIPMR